jgi:glutamate synthase (NADPH/NADH) small chain
LSQDALAEALPPLSAHEAIVEANRCLFCYDAPCTHACPTHIDIPRFIGKIVTENLTGSARTILESNLLGATCARVCPVQELCEGACVLGKDHKPIMIGRLQRYAMDHLNGNIARVLRIAPATGKKVAVIGAGAAGLSCAGELAKAGHSVTLFERRSMPGGLSTYGIIALREPVDVALAEVEMIRQLGVQIETSVEVGRDIAFEQLQTQYDATFLSSGLGATPSLDIPGEEYALDGLDYIESSKIDRQRLSVGRQVVVIGAGNTAIDCATVAARLGAERVTIVYRRTQREMTAYPHEYEFIRKEGVDFHFLTQPVRILHDGSKVIGIECLRMSLSEPDETGRARPLPISGSEFIIPADQVVKAIGQQKPSLIALLGLQSERGYVKVNGEFETSLPGVYAGGDCIRSTGSASTVMAVQDGKLAARAIHQRLVAGQERR